MQIGSIEYEARVTGAAEAKQDAHDFADSQNEAAAASEEAATAGGFLAGRLSDVADSNEEAGTQADRATTKSRIFTSALFFLGTTALTTVGRVTGLTAVIGTFTGAVATAKAALSGLTLSGVVGSVTGAISGFVGWLAAGSAGALAFAGAIGFGLGVLGVWILQVTGALDAVRGFGRFVGNVLPGWVRDGLLQMISLAAGPLAVFGSFIVGTLEGGFDEGFERARQTADVFVGAWKRQMGRIENLADDATAFVTTKFDQMGNAIVGTVRRAWNTNIPARINFPAATIAGRTIGGGGISIPRLQTGGLIEQSGIAVVDRGEAVIPAPIVNAANRGGGGGGGASVTIDTLTFELTGEFDPTNVSRRDLEEFAARIDEVLGHSTNTLAGVR